MGHFAAAFQFIQFDAVIGEPCAVGLCLGKLLFQLPVIVYLSFLCVYQKYLSGLQTAFLFDIIRFKIHYTHFAGHYHDVVACNEVAGGAQSVTVEHAACIAPVAEEQCGRSVPGLHKDGVVFVESLELLADRVLLVEGFRHKHRHGMRKAEPGHDEEFQYVVQRSAVAHVRLDDRAQLFDVAQGRRGQDALTRFHPTAVATYGVDFAVVRQKAEGLCQSPRREGVGAETGMYKGQSAGEVTVGQVGEVVTQLQR